MSKENVTEELLIQYLANEVNEEERRSVEEWLMIEENKTHFEQLKAIWSFTAIDYPAHVDSESSWRELQSKLQTQPGPGRVIKLKPVLLARVAAILLAIVSIAGWMFFSSRQSNDQQVAINQEKTTKPVKETVESTDAKISQPTQVAATNTDVQPASPSQEKKVTLGKPTRQRVLLANENHADVILASKKKEQVCNNTQCPLEICIVQSLKCGNNKSSVFAHCSMLQPDESGQLHYHENADCNSLVQEIRITRTTTGETIVLTPKSSPVTAQEFFDYMTGDKKGAIVAGIFETDCDNMCSDQSLRLDNRLGVPVIQ